MSSTNKVFKKIFNVDKVRILNVDFIPIIREKII